MSENLTARPPRPWALALWTRTLRRAALLSLLLLGAALPARGAGLSAGAGLADAAVSISSFAFSPQELRVAVGTTVTWTNNDPFAHTVVSSGTPQFESAALGQGQSFSQTFDQPGTVSYFCSIHPSMQGSVIVAQGEPTSIYLPLLATEPAP